MFAAVANGASGSIGGVLAMGLLYPLDNVRTRLQVQVKARRRASMEFMEQNRKQEMAALAAAAAAKAKEENDSDEEVAEVIQDEDNTLEYTFRTPLQCVRQVLAKEGWRGLYSGLSSALFGVGASSAIFFALLNAFQRIYAHVRSIRGKTGIHPGANLLLASCAGVINVYLTMPIWVVQQRLSIQSRKKLGSGAAAKGGDSNDEYSGMVDGFRKIYKEFGLKKGFYQGLYPALILVSNPAIQMAVYDYLVARAKVLAQTRGALSAGHYFMLGAIAKAVATVITYPYQVLKARMQAKTCKYSGLGDATRTMLAEEGVGAFYQGLSAKLSQTVLNAALMLAIKEPLFEAVMVVLRQAFGKTPR